LAGSPEVSIVLVPKNAKLGHGFTVKQQREGDEHPGRRTDGTQSAAHWVGNLVDLKKTVLLCSFCRANFNPRKNHYRRMYIADPSGHTDGYAVNGKCDACKQMTVNCGGGTAFVHESLYNVVCQDPIDARRKARAAAKSMSVWQAINK
jgi:hypothetical protein